MKAISLWQPWASLIAVGAKRIETRSWPAGHVGPLAIHAAKRWTPELYRLCLTEPFQSALIPHFETPEALPLGCIVATCRLIGCAPVRGWPYTFPSPVARMARALTIFGRLRSAVPPLRGCV